MNWKIILASLLLLAALGIVLVVGFMMLDGSRGEEAPPPPPEEAVPSFPESAGTGYVTVGSGSGADIEVQDFTHNGETIPDPVNPGSYVLAGSLGYCLADGSCPQGTPTDRFSVSYDGETGSFSIVLLKEPLREVRAEAQAYLRSRLGITDAQMCALDYYLGVPYFVNERFTGENLGFSFCAGATALP